MIEQIAITAKAASVQTAALDGEQKNAALRKIAKYLAAKEDQIIQANRLDLAQADSERLSTSLLKRLRFDSEKLAETIAGVESLINLPEPVGKTLIATELDDELELYRVSCPIGLLGVVFESRPDALVQISTLALKSGNAVLLKGGSEAANTNRILAEVIAEAARSAGLPDGWCALLESRQDVKDMLKLDRYIDLVIPRGSNQFVKYIMDNTRIPVLGHADGICHVYIDGQADIEKAIAVAFDSKCQYPAVCNAAETLLVDGEIAEVFLKKVKPLYDRAGVELRGDDRTIAIIDAQKATEQDWSTEYNDLVLSIKVVDGLDGAISHINRYGSGHTDAIVTEDAVCARRFMALVDSANVFWNCSTRFSDGYRYGLGAEVGISTNKIHARGPVGLEGLLIYKWKLLGRGHIVADYSGKDAQKRFTHRQSSEEFPL